MSSLLCYGAEMPAETDSLELRKIKLAEIIDWQLRDKADYYKKKFSRPAPNCGQCSDFERLIILENAIGMNVAYLEEDIKKELDRVKAEYKERFNRDVPNWDWSDERIADALKKALETNTPYCTKEKEMAIKAELKNVEAEYEKRFKIPVPWWWVLRTEEERLERLKKTLKANTPNIYYYVDEDMRGYLFSWDIYRLSCALAEYEVRFKKQPPEYQKGDIEIYGWYLRCLERAVKFNIPYLTREEKNKLKTEDEKIKTEYKKRFGMAITASELSTANVYFSAGGYGDGAGNFKIYTARTTTGIYVKCEPIGGFIKSIGGREKLETEFTMGEWLDFIRMIYKYSSSWKELYTYDFCGDGAVWGLEIFSLDKDELEPIKSYVGLCTKYPPNWNKFLREMDAMVAKIRKKRGAAPGSADKNLIRHYYRDPKWQSDD